MNHQPVVEKAESWLSTMMSMSGTAAVVGVTNLSGVGVDVGIDAVGVDVRVGVTVLVGEANGAVGLAGTSVSVGDTGVGGASVGVAVALAAGVGGALVGLIVAVAAIVGVPEGITVGEGVAYAAVGGGVDAGSPAPVHPASTMTTRSQQRKASL